MRLTGRSAGPAMPPRHRHFSMSRDFHVADFFTLANGGCGTAAIFLAMKHMREPTPGAVYAAAVLVVAALVFDVLDGRIARRRHSASPLGRELDSLADVISFGVAPAALAFSVGMSEELDALVLLLAALAWAGRTGPDLPFGAIGIGGADLHPLVLLFALSGSLMISKTLRIPKP